MNGQLLSQGQSNDQIETQSVGVGSFNVLDADCYGLQDLEENEDYQMQYFLDENRIVHDFGQSEQITTREERTLP